MSNQEFENYIALMGKLLQLSPDQREQIAGELKDHLQMRVADLMNEGMSQPDAVRQALEEFGDAAVMANNFRTVLNLKRRRWMMRFATFSIAGTFLAAILTMALWPDNARFGAPDQSVAQEETKEEKPDSQSAKPKWKMSTASKNTILAEEILKEIVTLNYDETPFADIEEHLEEMTGLNFLLTYSAADDSLTQDEPIRFELKNMPLGKALSLMLETKNAAYVIDSGIIKIISLDDAEDTKWMRLKMYDCRELVKALPKMAPIGGGGGGFSGFGIGGSAGGGGGGGSFAVPQSRTFQEDNKQDAPSTKPVDTSKLLDEKLNKLLEMAQAEALKNKPEPSAEVTLEELVVTMIGPDTWMDSGQGLGQLEVVNGILIVTQTENMHSQIGDLLNDLQSNILGGGKEEISAFLKHNKEMLAARRAAKEKSKRAEMKKPKKTQGPFANSPGGDDDPFK